MYLPRYHGTMNYIQLILIYSSPNPSDLLNILYKTMIEGQVGLHGTWHGILNYFWWYGRRTTLPRNNNPGQHLIMRIQRS